jgi:hypothetical protein
VKAFRDYFEEMNKKLQTGALTNTARVPILAEVIQVTEGCTYLDPVTETAEVQRMINSHNLALRDPSLSTKNIRSGRLNIKRVVFYTGYLLSQEDSNSMTENLLVPALSPGLADSNDLKYMANSILITPRPAPRSILEKVGGMGKKIKWKVTGTGTFENKIWAARVAPVSAAEPWYSDNPLPIVVLAVRKGSRLVDAGRIQNWHPVQADKAMTFDTVVGEKVVLKIETEDHYTFNKSHKRRFHDHDDTTVVNASHHTSYDGSSSHARGSHSSHQRGGGHHFDENSRRGSYRGRARGNARGRANRGGRGRGRGRGDHAAYHYRSLDDYGDASHGSNGGPGGGAGRGGYAMDY